MRARRTGTRVAPLLLLCALLCACGQARQPAPLYVNGQPVSEEELELLGGSRDEAVRMKVLQQLAQEHGVAEAFSYDGMLARLEEENRDRARRAEAGQPVYGLLSYSPVQYYRVLMGEYERAVKDQWIAGAEREDLLAYYREHREEYREIGEITAYAAACSDGVPVVEREEVTLSPETYRVLSERNDVLVAVLEGMAPGETAGWTDERGLEWTLECTGRTQDSYAPFEDVQGAVSEQWAGAKLEAELSERIAGSTIEEGNSLE